MISLQSNLHDGNMLTIRISLRFNAAPLSYKGLHFEYGNDVTSKKEQFIIQNLVGRDN